MKTSLDAVATCLLALAASAAAAPAQAASGNPPAQTRPGQQAAATLAPVVVTATTTARDALDAPASVSVTDGEALRRRPVNDLADAVRDSVGLDLADLGGGRRGISIRGMNPDHTLLLIDGQRINSSASAIAHSDFELGWMPTAAIERVEVVRGPMSSLYGSEALGGVLNVITRAATERWQGSVNAHLLRTGHGLDGDRRKAGFYFGGPLLPGRLGLNLWGEFRQRDALRSAGERALTMLDEQRARTAQLGLNWTPDARQRIDLSMSAGKEDQQGLRSSRASPFYRIDNEVQRRRFALSHAGSWDWGSTRLRLYRSTLERKVWRSDGADTAGPNRFVDTVLDAGAGFAAGAAHRLSVGFEARRESLEDPGVNRAGKEALTHYALFAQDEILLGERWELVLGSRFDRHEDFGWEASPRAYLLFHPGPGLAFKAGVGRGFKAPTLKQRSREFESRAAMGGRGIVRGNPDLRPETNRALELGASFEQAQWSASATLFRNDVRRLIETVRQPSCSEIGRICLEYVNVARVQLQGLELTLGANLSARWRLDANYTYLDARRRPGAGRLADRSRHRAHLALAWTPQAQLSTRVHAEYSGPQYRSAELDERPGYTLLHWYVDFALGRELSLHAGIENLGDRRLANDDASLHGRADEGRRLFAGLTAAF